MNVYGYWECPKCSAINRGDMMTCGCGQHLTKEIRFLPPNHPKVQKKPEPVPADKMNSSPNWICVCGCQVNSESDICPVCGKSKADSIGDYFSCTEGK